MFDRYKEEHESYGMVQVSRCSGGAGVFFGSALKHQHEYFEFRIYKAELHHDELGYDRYWTKELIAEFRMTPAQFTEMITTMNIGQGVPITFGTLPVEVLNGSYTLKRVNNPPDNSKVESQRVQDGFEEDVGKLVKQLEDAERQVVTILEKKSLTKDDKATILSSMMKVKRFAKDHAPHMLTMFREAAGKVVTQAKQEVDTMVTSFVHRTGLQTLQEKGLMKLQEHNPELPPEAAKEPKYFTHAPLGPHCLHCGRPSWEHGEVTRYCPS